MYSREFTLGQISEICFKTINAVMANTYADYEVNMFIVTWLEGPFMKFKKHAESIEKTRAGMVRKYGKAKEGNTDEYWIPQDTPEMKQFEKAWEKEMDKKVDIIFDQTDFRTSKRLKELKINFSAMELITLRHFITGDVPAENGEVKKGDLVN